MIRALLPLTLLLLTSCTREAEQPREAVSDATSSDAESMRSAAEPGKAPPSETVSPVVPPAPGTPGGLPDDRTPLSEAPFSPTSAQGAANVVQTYYALVAAGRHGEAWQLWSHGGEASGMTAEAFAKSFASYASYNANVGEPGAIEGAAGSLYVSVPIQIYGRRKSGEDVHLLGEVALRRVNDVPGSTAEQRLWHILRIDLKATPRG